MKRVALLAVVPALIAGLVGAVLIGSPMYLLQMHSGPGPQEPARRIPGSGGPLPENIVLVALAAYVLIVAGAWVAMRLRRS